MNVRFDPPVKTIGQLLRRLGDIPADRVRFDPVPGTATVGDLLKPEWEALRGQAIALQGCNGSDEDVLTYAMFPQVAPKFFSARSEGPKNLGKDPAKPAAAPGAPAKDGKGPVTTTITYEVKVNGKSTKVTVSPA